MMGDEVGRKVEKTYSLQVSEPKLAKCLTVKKV